MGEVKHTPGPWRIAQEEFGLYMVGHTPINTMKPHGRLQWDGLAQVATIVDGNENHEGVANARLIATAPELLEVLEAIIEQSNRIDRDSGGKPYRTPECQQLYDKAFSVVAKATTA
jgi:hypothetical protein